MLKLSLFIFFFFISYANAYFGPGLAFGGVALAIGFIIAAIVVFFSIIFFPIKILIKKFKKNKNKKEKIDGKLD